MAKGTLRLKSFIFVIGFATQISSSIVQPSLAEYLLATLGQQGPSIPSKPLNYQGISYAPGYQKYQTPPVYPSPPKPSPTLTGSLPSPLTAIANLAAAIPVTDSKSPKTPCVPKSSNIPSSNFDSNVLNNLAIALQLLIVSNILNTSPAENLPQNKFDFPKFESTSKFETLPISPITFKSSPSLSYSEEPIQNQYSYTSVNLPNYKFLGSSGFVEPSMFGSSLPSMNPRPSPRSSMTLMSPYEALGPNSPFSDPVLSSVYGSSSYSKSDFQSPYASILAADKSKDLFSFNDLF